MASRMYSLILSCREVGIDPEAYLVDVLERVSLTSDVTELTPWAWAARRGDGARD